MQIFHVRISSILPVGTTCEHLGFCIALHVPTLVVVSKVDLCSQQLVEQTVAQMEELLMSPGCKKTPRVIKSENDAYTTAQQLNELRLLSVH